MARISKKIHSVLGPLFYKIAENSDQVYWIRTSDFQTLLYVSPAIETVFGVPRKKIYDNPLLWMKSIIPSDRDRIRQQFMEWQVAISPDRVYKTHYCIRRSSGKTQHLKDIGIPIFDGGICIAYIGVASLQLDDDSNMPDGSTSQFFQYFIEKSDAVFWVKDKSGKKQLFINDAYERIWQTTTAALKKDPEIWYDAIVDEDKLTESEIHASPIHPVKGRYRISRPDGEIRWIKDTSFPVHNDCGDHLGYAGIAQDITIDARREHELTEAKEAAEKANKVKSDFLAMMSHELRTPLNAILGMAQILRQSPLGREQEDQIDVVVQAGNNLLSLLNDILDFTKIEVGKLTFTTEDIQLYTLAERLVAEMQTDASHKSLSLHCEIDKDVPKFIVGDSKRLSQILVNLLSNAIKYTNKGSISLTVSCLQKNSKEAAVCFSVEDTGIGIEKSKLNSVFNRFQQIDSVYRRKHSGVGLGLAIVKELVDRMGGSIAVSSELGVGSQFTCIIPFGLQVKKTNLLRRPFLANRIRKTFELQNKQSHHFPANVLVVEDNVINQKISKTLLEQLGCTVEIAGDASSALQKELASFDLIFMDIGLPDMDGFEATRKIRQMEQDHHRVPIVAMTAHVFDHDRERCFEVGMDEVVAKPIMRDSLLSVLKRWAV